MTTPVPVPPLIQAAPWPALGSPNYNDEAYAAGSSQPAAFARQAEIAQSSADNAQISHDNSVTAVQASQIAQDARDAAAGAANFRGLWSTLSGPLNKPASVKHNNRIWLLLNNLADVAASEPGVSADWTSGDSGALVQIVNASTAIVPGPVYVAAAVGITLTLPDTLGAGDTIDVRNVSGGQIYIDWSGHTVKGLVPQSPMAVPKLRGISLVYTGGTFA